MAIQELDLVILKHILSSKKNALEFAHDCSEKLFVIDAWRFAKLILDYIKTYKEIPTRKVINERIQNQKSESLNKYINQLWDDIDNTKIDEREYKHNLEKLKNRFAEKLIYELKDRLVGADGRIDIAKSVGELNNTNNSIKTLSTTRVYDQKSLKEGIKEFRDNYQAKLNDPNFGVGIKSGYTFFDSVTNGMFGGEVLIIGAETNGGKSMLLSNMAHGMWIGDNTIEMTDPPKEGNDILYFSLEMPWADCQSRIMARLAMVPQTSIRDATLTPDELKRVGQAVKFIENYTNEFHIVDMPRGATMEAIELVFNDIVATKQRKPKVVVIDYLTLMDCPEEEADWLKTGKLAEKFHEFCRVADVIGLTATQLNRAKPGAGGGAMSVDRIARSSLQAANANFVMLIEKKPNEQDMPTMNVSLVKNRRGQLVNGVLHKQLNCCALLNQTIQGDFTTAADISSEIEDI